MINFKKICRVLLVAAFICTLATDVLAILPENFQKGRTEALPQKQTLADCQALCTAETRTCELQSDGSYSCVIKKEEKRGEEQAEKQASEVAAGTNTTQSASAVTGCSSNYGLFSGLIETGRKIFSGLRDLIYVVAGFGIIGVAVGGFFGNLNWKWLGAIIIALVVIATTGEIINMITGCDEFTATMITDTLK